MASDDSLQRGREAFERWAWRDAHAQLSVADERGSLGAEDLERLGMAAYLTGRLDPAAEVWERAFRVLVDGGEVPVRCGVRSGWG